MPPAPPDRPKPPSSMNPNAPPFRPSGRDSGLPQPHSGYEGGWDDEATWGKEAEVWHPKTGTKGCHEIKT